MFLYSLARKANAQLKKLKKKQAGRRLSPVRRIEFVAPPASGRFCAMTFDDGPCALPPVPWEEDGRGLTEVLLDTLGDYSAKGTFDIIGSTAHNYPDDPGKAGDFSWSGVAFDHYPRFGEDRQAGGRNLPALLRRILNEDHEITNHSDAHRLFGPMKAVYGGRNCFSSLEEVTADLNGLHRLLLDQFGYEMKLARPPHYIDRIPKGGTAYDAYRILGYQYMAASCDGGGWLPSCGSYEEDVERMVAPMKAALEKDPDCLNGAIIFQKDGCNMSFQTPIAHALPRQLALLKAAGYRVITVSQLLSLSPFEDMNERHCAYPAVQKLLRAGHIVGYRNNTFQGDRPITKDEFALMVCPPEVFRKKKPLSYKAMTAIARDYCARKEIPRMADGKSMLAFAQKRNIALTEAHFQGKKVPRKYAAELLAALVK